MADDRPLALVYRDLLLPTSNTFVRDHVASLGRWRGLLLGGRPVAGCALDGIEHAVVGGRDPLRLREIVAHKLLGRSRLIDRLIAERRPRLIHAHFGADAMYMLPYARRWRLPLVVTFHGIDVLYDHSTWARRRRAHWSFRRFHRHRAALFAYASALLPVSGFLRTALLALGAPPARTTVHYLGTRLAPPPQPAPGRGDAVLFVGRVIPRKGVFHLLDALARLRAAGAAPPLWMVGDGEALPACRARAAALGLEAVFTGALDAAGVRARMASARLLCVPSIAGDDGWRESFGLVAIEAAAQGLPVVAYRSGGLGESVAEGITGVLCPEGDVAALAAALARLHADQAQRDRLAGAGPAWVRERFDLVRRTALLEDLYDRVAAEGPPAA